MNAAVEPEVSSNKAAENVLIATLFLCVLLLIAEGSTLGIILGLADIIFKTSLLHLSTAWTIIFTMAMLALTCGLCRIIYKILQSGIFQKSLLQPPSQLPSDHNI